MTVLTVFQRTHQKYTARDAARSRIRTAVRAAARRSKPPTLPTLSFLEKGKGYDEGEGPRKRGDTQSAQTATSELRLL